MRDYTATGHTHHNRRAGDVSALREVLVFFSLDVIVVVIACLVMGH